MRPALPRSKNPRAITVGEHPTGLGWDPAGKEKVLAYVDRVDHAADALHSQFKALIAENWGDVDPDKQKVPTALEKDFVAKWIPWYSKWKAYASTLPGFFNVWSPAAEWDRVLLFDQEEEAFRKTFVEITKGKKTKPPPPPPEGGTHEKPGGNDSGSLLDTFGLQSIPWWPILGIATVGVGGYIAVNYWQAHKSTQEAK